MLCARRKVLRNWLKHWVAISYVKGSGVKTSFFTSFIPLCFSPLINHNRAFLSLFSNNTLSQGSASIWSYIYKTSMRINTTEIIKAIVKSWSPVLPLLK
jgi:hypothetical protein